MADIAFERVTKRFPDGTVAVRDLDLTVADGEMVILVGPSGCGKSTALRMVAGLEDVSEGEILLDGEPMTRRSPSERDIAMVFQNYALYPHMTVAANMGFGLRNRRIPRAQVRAKVRETARTLELEHLLDRKPAHLSGGQRQRVAMGRAIVRDPKAFLMDEPLSNLDAKLRVQMRAEIARLKQRLGATMLYVTHDQTEAMTLGDRVVAMRGGVLQQAGTPQELYRRPANRFVAGFIGSPAMNFVEGRLDGDALVLPFATVRLGAERRGRIGVADGTPVVAGLRPQAFVQADDADGADGRGPAFEAIVDVMESLGSESFAYCTLRAADVDPVTVRLDGESTLAVGDRVLLRVTADAVHLFETDGDGRNLEP